MTDPNAAPEPTHAPLHTVSRGRARWHRGLVRPVLQRRADVVPAAQAVAFVIGIAVALIAGALLLFAAGNDPAQVYGRMIDSSLGGINSISRTLLRATPLALAGLAVAVAGSMGLWNIGAEGQMMAGATVAAGFAMSAGDLPGPLLILLMLIAGAVGGVVLMVGPALARAYLGVSEIITTLMLVEVSIRIVEWLETGPWKDPESQGFALIEPLPDQASLPGLFGRAHIGALFAVALLVAFWLAVSRTAWGYELRMAGSSPATARYAGISLQRKVLAALLLSGGWRPRWRYRAHRNRDAARSGPVQRIRLRRDHRGGARADAAIGRGSGGLRVRRGASGRAVDPDAWSHQLHRDDPASHDPHRRTGGRRAAQLPHPVGATGRPRA